MATITPGYFIIDGWVSRAEMYSLGLQIPDFPIQSDMTNGRNWIRPGNNADIIKPARFVDTPMGSRYAYGGLVWQWPMVNLSPKMVSYIQETYFQPNGTPSNFYFREWSNKLTVQTFNRTSGEWETYHTWGRFADVANEASPIAGGFTDLAINFTAFAVAPDGPDVTPTIGAVGTDFYVGIEFDAAFSIQNVGDGDTIQDTQWEIALPINVELTSISGAYPTTIEYSTDNGVNYSTTPPTPLTDTTNLRGTLQNELESGEVTDDYDLTFVPLAEGALDLTVTATTASDQDDTNDSDTASITILAFTPVALSPTLWLDGDVGVDSDLVGTDANDTDPVANWEDQSVGGDYDLQQGTGSLQPTYATNAANGHAGIVFDGTDDTLSATGLTQISAPFTWYIVIDPAPFSAGGETLIRTNYALLHQIPTLTQDQVGFAPSSAAAATGVAASTDTLQILEMQSDGTVNTGLDIFRNGSLLGNIAQASITGATTLRIGADDAVGTNPFEGTIFEIIAFDSYLNTTNRTLIVDYLKDKYAIP